MWDQMPEVTGQALTVNAGITATAAAQSGDFTYTTANGAVMITGYTGAGGDVEIPAQIEGLPVTAIGNSAFSGKASLTSVMIPNNVMAIGSAAFQSCTSLRSMTLPNGVTIMEGFLFAGCTNLISVDIPNSVSRIGYYAFGGCVSLTDVTIPDSVTSIGYGAFASCQSITSIALPSSLTTLERYLFGGCTSLASVSMSGNVTSIEPRVFSGCSALTSAYFVGSPPTLGDNVFADCPAIIYRLPEATGWSSTYDGRPVEIFRPVDVAAGQTTTPTIDAASSRVLKQGAGTAILTTPSSRTGGTVVEAGELVVRNKDALGTGLLEVQSGAKATFQTGYDTVAVTSLSLANTARLEVGTGKLAVAANGFTESDIRSKLIAGRNGGSWDGPSGITSTFAGGDRSIGYRVADGVLDVAYAAAGDSNLDGVIDILDIADILSAGKFDTGAAANWQQGDVNYDDVFDIVDVADIYGTNLFNSTAVASAPSIISATPGNGTATITFSAPASTGGATITNYAYSTDDGATYTPVSPAATGSTVVIPGLVNGTTYQIRVRAVNAAGDGAASTAVAVTPRTTPSAPSIISATPGNGTATITFSAPASTGGAAVAGYVIEFKTVAAATWTEFATTDSTARSADVTGLQNNTAYVFRVSARNAAGTGGPSPESASVTPWAPWVQTAGGTGADSGQDVALLPDGSSLVTGSFEGTMSFGTTTLTSADGTDFYVAKFDAAGGFVWARAAGGTGYDAGTGIVALADGSALVTGRFLGPAMFGTTTLSGDFVAKIDAAGNVVWATVAPYSVEGVAALPDGSSLVIGQASGAIAVGRLDAAGTVVWTRQAALSGYGYGSSIAALADGSAIITGAFDGMATFGAITLTSAGISDAFVAKLDAAGSFVWATSAGGTGTDYGQDVAVLPDGSTLVAGRFDLTATFGSTTLTSGGSSDAFVTKLDAVGSFVWATRMGGADYDFASGIASLPDGSAILTGSFEEEAAFGSTTLTSAGFGDAFAAKLDPSGSVVWASRAGGPVNDDGSRVAARADGSAVVTGRFEGTASFGSTTLTSVGGPDLFVARLDAAGTWQAAGGTTTATPTGSGGVSTKASTSGQFTTTGTVAGGGSAWTTLTGVKSQTPGGRIQQTMVVRTIDACRATWTFPTLTPGYYRVEILFPGRFDNSAAVSVQAKSTKDTQFISRTISKMDMRRNSSTFVNTKTNVTPFLGSNWNSYIWVDPAANSNSGTLSVRLSSLFGSGRVVADTVVLTWISGNK